MPLDQCSGLRHCSCCVLSWIALHSGSIWSGFTSITAHVLLLEKSLRIGRVGANIWCITVCIIATSCPELTLGECYLLSKTASQAFYSLGLNCSPAMNETRHQLSPLRHVDKMSIAEPLPAQNMVNWWTGWDTGGAMNWRFIWAALHG